MTSTAACRALSPNTCNTWIPAYKANGDKYFFDDWCTCGNGGAAPATAVNTLPSVAGATCYTSTSGNMRAPTTPATGACTLALLTAATTTNTTAATPASTSAAAPASLSSAGLLLGSLLATAM